MNFFYNTSDFFKKKLLGKIKPLVPDFSLSAPDFRKIKSFGFFGLGKSNIAVLDYIKRSFPNAAVTIRDDKGGACVTTQDFNKHYFGKDAYSQIEEEVLFLSPSVRRDRHELIAAAARGVCLYSDAEFFFNFVCPTAFGITGSDGKSTTTMLLASILCAAGYPAVPCGNFGTPFCSLIGECVLPIAELSSFQLAYLSPRLDTAIITNITENHLDWHKSFEEYVGIKLSVFSNASRAVIDADCHVLASYSPSRELFSAVSTKSKYSNLCKRLLAKYIITVENSHICLNGMPIVSNNIFDGFSDYNVKNSLLAFAASLEYVSIEHMLAAIRGFSPLPHRSTLVADNGGIRYINSSIDTTPERTAATIKSIEGDTVVILCGRSKGASLEPLLRALLSGTVGAVVFGDIKEAIVLAVAADPRFKKYRLETAKSFADAIPTAVEILGRGGTVLLSPSATSFDFYSGFEQRGEDFAAAVMRYIAASSV